MMVGITMALTIIVCLFAFIWIYASIGPLLSDFIPNNPTATETPSAQPSASETEQTSTSGSAADPAASESQPPASQAPDWTATHRIADGDDINFRAEATTDSNSLAVLSPGTLLKSLGEEQTAEGATWIHFETEDGTKGWVRSVDVVQNNS
jgi:cytoskeletal protein RodZ